MKVFNGDIRLLGPRPSGKLMYLATLAYFPDNKTGSLVKSVVPINNETSLLTTLAEDLIEQGLVLAAMPYKNVDDMPFYALLINLNLPSESIFKFRRQSEEIQLNLSCKPYPGEMFEDLIKKPDSYLDEYLDDLSTTNQIMLMIDATSIPKDRDYATKITKLEQELSQRLEAKTKSTYRIAVVFSKFDQPQAYKYLNDLDRFSSLKFFHVKSSLTKWSKSWNCSIEYFACSVYGMIGDSPIANATLNHTVDWGTSANLQEPNNWQPFGLISPIYWLLTGKRDKRLD